MEALSTPFNYILSFKILFLSLTSLFLVSQVLFEFSTGSTSTCMKSFPSKGTFLKQSPYWQFKECSRVRDFNQSEAHSCMRNRTIYVIGISTARQYAFHMSSLLGGIRYDRNNQKQMCPKQSQD